MKLGELLLILLFIGLGGGLLLYSFGDYLFARTVGPSTPSIIVKRGEALRLQIPTEKSTAHIDVKLCGQAGVLGLTCSPLAINSDVPVSVRVPIGYGVGPATLQVFEQTGPQGGHLLYSINLTIR